MRTDADARGPTNPTTRVRWANASTARKTRQRLSPSGRIAKCPALRPPSARRVGMGLTCCWSRKISGGRISNWEFQMIKAKEAKNRKRTTRKHPPFADIAKVEHPKNPRQVRNSMWATHRIYQHLSRANRPGPSANLVSGRLSQALSPGPRFRSRIVKSLDHR